MIEQIFVGSEAKTIVTANRRQTRYLKHLYQQHLKSGICLVHILPWENWIRQTFYTLNDQFILLSQHQSTHLWFQIIQKHHPNLLSHQIHSLANIAEQGWRLIKEWQIKNDQTYFHNEEAHQFHHYCQEFQTYCDKNQWVDYYLAIEKCIQNSPNLVQQSIQFYGFSQWTPLRESFVKRLISAGQNTKIIEPQKKLNPKHQSFQSIFEHFFDEIQAALLWAKEKQKEEESVAIIIPNLKKSRNLINTFAKTTFQNCKTPFNISVPECIDQQPFILDLITYFSWFLQPLSTQDIIQLLQSPYFELIEKRQTVDVLKFLQLCSALSLEQFKNKLDKRLFKNNIYPQISNQKNTITEWISLFLQHLDHINWTLSKEHQQITFNKLLDTLLTLDQLNLHIDFATFFHLLKHQSNALSKPDKPNDKAIQILEPKEAIGFSFKHIWVTKLHHHNFPERTNIHPWIDIRLQKQANIHQAHEHLQYQLANNLINTLKKQSQKTFIISFSHYETAGINSPSSLFKKNTKPLKAKQTQKISPFNLEQINDWQISQKNINRTISVANADIFLNCPFQYFCKQQIGLQFQHIQTLILPTSQQGNWLHKALELLYTNHQVQNIQSRQIQANVEKAYLALQYKLPPAIKNNLAQTLMNLIKQMIQHEKKQNTTPIQTECEKTIEYRINNITFKGRIDRIDTQADNNQHIIDYKYTLSQKENLQAKHLFEDPFKTIQLPIYALATKKSTKVQWYIFKPEGFKIVSHSNIETNIQIKLKNKWQEFIDKISKKISEGHYMPVPSTQACRQCNFKHICRAKEKQN